MFYIINFYLFNIINYISNYKMLLILNILSEFIGLFRIYTVMYILKVCIDIPKELIKIYVINK